MTKNGSSTNRITFMLIAGPLQLLTKSLSISTILLLLYCIPPQPNNSTGHGIAMPTSVHITNDSHAPCGVCDLTVGWDQRAVACETCGLWFHITCQDIGTLTHDALNDSNTSWHCAICGNANPSHTAFDLHGIDQESDAALDTSDMSLPSTASGFKPLHSSTPSRVSQLNKQKDRPLRLLNVNFQCATAKKAQIPLFLDSLKPDVVVGTETWLDSTVHTNEFMPTNYTTIRKDRNRRGGGILIAVKEGIECVTLEELSTDCEILWVKLLPKQKGSRPTIVCAYYRPDVSDEISLVKLEESLKKAEAVLRNSNVILAGDFNFRSFDWTTEAVRIKSPAKYVNLHRQFLDLLRDNNLNQLVTFPTREDNTLDLVITNVPQFIPRVEAVPGLSDHLAIYFEMKTKVSVRNGPPRPIPQYSKANWKQIRDDMRSLQTQITEIRTTASADRMWMLFREGLQTSVTNNIPSKTTRRKTGQPWVSRDIRLLLRKRDRKYKQWKKLGTDKLRTEILYLRREIQKKLRQAYWNYVSKLFEDTEEENTNIPSSKRFWTYMKHQRATSTGVPPLKKDGQLITEPKEKAELMNLQFSKAFSNGKSYTADEFQTRNAMPSPRDNHSSMSKIEISTRGVEKLLKSLNPHKAAGPDGISPKVLRELATEIAPILSLIYRSSLETGVVPEDWKTALVTPIYKKGQHYDPGNYRPISLTSVPCKVLEHILVSEIMTHLESNNILSDQQHGFRRGRSCESQLLECAEVLSHNMESGFPTDVVVMDFAKAFDKVNHSLLVHKLDHYGIRGEANSWISEFLQGRSQAVVVEGTRSDTVSVRSGVPQGSVLGPCLFLIYINDLPDRVSSLARLFADDTLLERLIKQPEDQDALQTDLHRLEQWETAWDMQFHPDKCSVMHVTRQRDPTQPRYTLHDETLGTVTSTKYLGVTLQNNGKWDTHIHNITAKANSILGFVRRNLKVKQQKVKEQAYKSLVRPLLEYASSVWDPQCQKHIQDIEAVQRRAARFVMNDYHMTSSVTAMMKTLKWPTLQQRRKNARLTALYKILNNQLHVRCKHLRKFSPKTRRSHDQQIMRITCRTNQRQESFFPCTIRDWNSLPQEVVQAPSAAAFSRRLQAQT